MSDQTGATAKRVKFALAAEAGAEVFVAGSFNNWNPSELRMQANGDGIYRRTVPLPPGTHEYKFVVNGRWVDDSLNPDRTQNEFGSFNNVLSI